MTFSYDTPCKILAPVTLSGTWLSRCRFSSENLSELKSDQRSKPSTPVSPSPIQSKAGADWLGLKDEDFDSPPPSPPKEFRKGGLRGAALDMSSNPSDDEHPLRTRLKPAAEERIQKPEAMKPEAMKDDDDSWLSNVLSQKKSQAQEKIEEKRGEPSEPVRYGEEVTPIPLSRYNQRFLHFLHLKFFGIYKQKAISHLCCVTIVLFKLISPPNS